MGGGGVLNILVYGLVFVRVHIASFEFGSEGEVCALPTLYYVGLSESCLCQSAGKHGSVFIHDPCCHSRVLS